MNILEAFADPDLFGPHFRGNTWAAWRAFLAGLFALPMDDEALELFRAHTGRAEPPRGPFKEAALIVGRRGGKSRVLALIAVYLACFRDYAPHLAPGEVATIAVLAADRKQARTVFRYARGLLREIGWEVTDETADTIALGNSVQIEITTASLRTTRGYTFAAILADESAFWRSDETAANPDAEIFRALRPGMATIPGSMLLNASSPYRKRGVLHQAYARHFGKDDAPVLVWKATSQQMNPALDPAIVQEALEADPEAAAAEYFAEFRNDLADFVQRDVVEACVIPGRHELPKSGRHVAFVDPSGGSADSMTLGIAHLDTTDRELAVLDALREIRPPFSPEAVVSEFAGLLKSYGLSTVTGDRYAGEWPRERFKVHGIRYDVSERTKGEIYLNSLPALNSRKLELLDVPRLTQQLCGLERRVARGGRDSIDHGPGAHDDLANAALGALLLAKTRAPMVISKEFLAGASATPEHDARRAWRGRPW